MGTCVGPTRIFPQGHKRLFHGGRKWSSSPHIWVSYFPFSFSCAPESLSVAAAAYFKHSVAPLPLCSTRCWREGKKNAQLCSPSDFAAGLHHEILGLCGHHAAELSQRAKITPGQEGKGRRLGRRNNTSANFPSYLFILSGDTFTGAFFFLNPHHTVLVLSFPCSLPLSLLLCVGSKAATCVRE